MQGQKIVYVDALADRPFRGNAAAVVVLTEERSEEWSRQGLFCHQIIRFMPVYHDTASGEPP